MNDSRLSRPALGRLPRYLEYLQSIAATTPTISATRISQALGLGEVQVRKELALVSGAGKPKMGYETESLIQQLKERIGLTTKHQAIIVGAGHLGQALLAYDGFAEYGLSIAAAFDSCPAVCQISDTARPILPISELSAFCFRNHIRIGVIAVPKEAAQSVCDLLIANNITAIWSFAPVALSVPEGITLREENLALSLAYLKQSLSCT